MDTISYKMDISEGENALMWSTWKAPMAALTVSEMVTKRV